MLHLTLAKAFRMHGIRWHSQVPTLLFVKGPKAPNGKHYMLMQRVWT